MSSARPLLTSLPVELIEAIGVLLESADLCSLRLACKLPYRVTARHFGRTYLQRVEIDLSLSSLDRLAAISQHRQLRHHVHHITINGIERGVSWDRHPSGHLIFPQPITQQLQDILTLLPNCNSFHISGVGIVGATLRPDCVCASDIVTVFLHIVAETGLPVRSLSVDINTREQELEAIDMGVRRICMPDLQKPGFITGWSHLHELSLRQSVVPGSENFVTGLITNAPNLEKLTIEFDEGEASEYVIQRLSSADSLPQLQHLDLEFATLGRADTFLSFLRHFRHSLRTLHLCRIFLDVGGWRPVLAGLSNGFTSLDSIRLATLWNPRDRIVHFPALLSNPFVNGSNGRRFIFSFVENRLGGTGRFRVMWVGYRGPEMDVALQTLVRHAKTVQWG